MAIQEFVSRVWTKQQTQATIKDLRKLGLPVTKISSGYEGKVGDTLVFKAMIGTNGYLVRYRPELFEAI